MISENEEHSNLYHMEGYSPLVEVIDEQKGFCLLKNHCPFDERHYAVGITLEDGRPHMVMKTTEDHWLTHEQADEVMRNALKKKSYNKASTDYFNEIQEE